MHQDSFEILWLLFECIAFFITGKQNKIILDELEAEKKRLRGQTVKDSVGPP